MSSSGTITFHKHCQKCHSTNILDLDLIESTCECQKSLSGSDESFKEFSKVLEIPPKILTRAKIYYKQFIDGIMATNYFNSFDLTKCLCLFIAAKVEGHVLHWRTIKMVVKKRKMKGTTYLYDSICKNLGIDLDNSYVVYICKFVNQLNLSDLVKEKSLEFAKYNIENNIISSKEPINVAAYSIAFVTQADVSLLKQISKISKIPIQKIKKHLLKY